MINLTSINFNEEVELSDGLIVIDLYADWCAPCRMLSPILEELEREIPSAKFCKINIDNERELAQIFRVESIPMIAIVKDNTFLDLSVGLVSKEEISALILSYA